MTHKIRMDERIREDWIALMTYAEACRALRETVEAA